MNVLARLLAAILAKPDERGKQKVSTQRPNYETGAISGAGSVIFGSGFFSSASFSAAFSCSFTSEAGPAMVSIVPPSFVFWISRHG